MLGSMNSYDDSSNGTGGGEGTSFASLENRCSPEFRSFNTEQTGNVTDDEEDIEAVGGATRERPGLRSSSSILKSIANLGELDDDINEDRHSEYSGSGCAVTEIDHFSNASKVPKRGQNAYTLRRRQQRRKIGIASLVCFAVVVGACVSSYVAYRFLGPPSKQQQGEQGEDLGQEHDALPRVDNNNVTATVTDGEDVTINAQEETVATSILSPPENQYDDIGKGEDMRGQLVDDLSEGEFMRGDVLGSSPATATTPPRPPVNLEQLCSSSTDVSLIQCWSACELAVCCHDSCSDHDDCDAYEICWIPSSAVVGEGQETAEQWGGEPEHEEGEQQENKPFVVVDLEVEELCAADRINDMGEERSFCEVACERRSCCFNSTAGGDGTGECYEENVSWCQEYAPCFQLSHPPVGETVETFEGDVSLELETEVETEENEGEAPLTSLKLTSVNETMSIEEACSEDNLDSEQGHSQCLKVCESRECCSAQGEEVQNGSAASSCSSEQVGSAAEGEFCRGYESSCEALFTQEDVLTEEVPKGRTSQGLATGRAEKLRTP